MRFLARQLVDLLIGIAVTFALFGCAELVVRALDVGGTLPPRHLSAGFDPSVRTLVRDPEVEGGYRTRDSHDRSLELVIPPKGEAPRVILFGGSNTARLQRGVLQDALEEQVGSAFEVLNLGRSGYGSSRVAILFREALVTLDPDIVVLYSGHNEFVEKSFAMDVKAAWPNPVVQALATGLERTRTGQLLLRGLQDTDRDTARYTRLADWEAEYDKFADLGWNETLTVWDAYEENLRYMCTLAQERGVRVVLCTLVWNRFSAPRISRLEGADVAEAQALLQAARAQYPPQFRALSPQQEADRVHSFDWGRPRDRRPKGEVVEPLPGLRPSTGMLAQQDPGFPTDLIWKPKVRLLYTVLAWLHEGPDQEQREALERSRDSLDRVLELVPDHAGARYERALARYALGERGASVRAEFERAARVDRAPRKANPLSNERVREIAADFDVLFHDADARFAACCPDGLVGWEWMVDHCHLSRGGGEAFLKDLAGVIAQTWYGEGGQ